MKRSRGRIRTPLPGALTLALIALLPSPARAAVFNVAAGDTVGLIAAIETANANGEADTIDLAAGTYTLSAPCPLTLDGLPEITSDITITVPEPVRR